MGQNGLVQVVSQEAEAVRDSSSIKSGSPKRRRDNMLDVYILYLLLLLLFFNVDIFYTSSSRASRGRKFQKKKVVYSKERICL